MEDASDVDRFPYADTLELAGKGTCPMILSMTDHGLETLVSLNEFENIIVKDNNSLAIQISDY